MKQDDDFSHIHSIFLGDICLAIVHELENITKSEI